MKLRILIVSLLGTLLYTCHAKIWISEFVADNESAYVDEDGDEEDWIELYNDSPSPTDLTGWSLTDNDSDLQKWLFPTGTSIPANGYLVIFASGKNRRQYEETLHTNFSLKKGGEYLALVQSDGTTIEHAYSSEYPPQFGGLSYGLNQATSTSTVVTSGATGQAGVPTSLADFNANYTNWNVTKNATFTGSNWQSVSTGVGYERSSGYGTWLGSDLETVMYATNTSVFLRVPFSVSDASSVGNIALRMRWDDGFVAYINGVQIAGHNNPASPTWNSNATGYRGDDQNEDWITFSIDPSALGLVNGTNLLAIQGFNENTTSSDMLILPELDITYTGPVSATAAYHLSPSPGYANGTGTLEVPPYLHDATDQADRPVGGIGSAPILITAQVDETEDSIDTVSLHYCIMFGSEIELTMYDTGTNGDSTAGDAIYSAYLPTTELASGEMLRWRIEATDDAGRTAYAPRYDDPLDSDRYYGTVAVNATHSTSQLPIIETFIDDTAAADTRGGTRGALYYLGEFYDNVQIDLHGQSTAGEAFPKKSYDLDFNSGNRFRWHPDEQRVKDVNLLTNWADKSKMRNTLAYEFFAACGVAHHFAFPVRVERNGTFFTISDMVEDGDDRYLDRIGLDPNGTLYKMYDKLENAADSVKKTRKDEGTADLAALIAGIDDALPRDTRRLYAYDHVNIAATINYLAALIVADITDVGHKNYYMYRDTEGSGEWHPLPWDVDLSAGRRWNSTDKYFDDTLFSNRWIWSPNRLWELMQDTPEFRSMLLRRIETLRTDILQPPGTPELGDWYVERIEALKDQLDPSGVVSDADLDYSAWGSWGNHLQVRAAADRIIDEWLPAKRDYMFSSSRNHNGEYIPAPQPAVPAITIETIDFLPASGNPDEEYLVLKNLDSSAIDLSGWTLSGAIDYTFPAGTVIPAGNGDAAADYIGLLHIARDAKAFRARAGSVSGNQYRYVQGGYGGQLSARGETVELYSASGALVASKSYADQATDAQQYLRITEIMYQPQPDTAITPDAQDFEYIELRNISDTETLDLSDIRFTKGVEFDFTGSAVTTLLPGDYVLVVSNTSAFTARYGSDLPVAGAFYGTLDNNGETLRLDDAAGEKVLEFSYNNAWQPMTDSLGFSLEVIDDTINWDLWGASSTWRMSGVVDGSPGAHNTAPPVISEILINEILAHTDLPQKDSIELYNPTESAVDISGWYLSDDFYAPKKYRIPDNTTIASQGYLVIDSDAFGNGDIPFLLSEHGESACLFSASPDGALSGYYHRIDFKASPNGVSTGRYIDSEGDVHYVLQSSLTLGSVNAAPAVGPVVIATIHYHPPEAIATIDNDQDEYIELVNITNTAVPLYSTDISVPGYGSNALNDTWRLRNAVDYDFPTGITLAAGERILVVGFDPTVDTTQMDTLRALYHLSPSIRVFGPWSGKLDNSKEQIELKRPGSADPIPPYEVPYYMVDEITYHDDTPWPASADGDGAALVRRDTSAFGDDPLNWRAASALDTDNDTMPDWLERLHGLIVGTDDRALDADQDGFTNQEELTLGTAPLDSQSFMALQLSTGSTQTMLNFTAYPDITYTVQYKTELSAENWLNLQQVDAEATERNIMIPDTLGHSKFFRIVSPQISD